MITGSLIIVLAAVLQEHDLVHPYILAFLYILGGGLVFGTAARFDRAINHKIEYSFLKSKVGLETAHAAIQREQDKQAR